MKRAALAILLLSGSAWAQTPPLSQILVSATGTAKTPPDMATVGFTLRGEGATSDEAVVKLRDGAKTMAAGVASLLGKAEAYHASNFSIAQVRSKDCDASNYGQQRLSTGPCAIIGYVATMPVSVDTPLISDAGTLAGLISRLGGVEVGVRSFWLKDEVAAHHRAMQAAFTSARDQAQLIAQGSGAKLGQLLRVQDADYHELSLDMPAASQGPIGQPPPPAPPPPPPPPPPVRVDLSPEPIKTTVRLMAAYAVDP